MVLKPDPRPAYDVNQLGLIQQKLKAQLPKLSGRFDPVALDKLANLSADAIRASGIHPSDYEKLYKKLSSARGTTQDFINNFHDAPGFEQVLLIGRRASTSIRGLGSGWRAQRHGRDRASR